MAIETVNNWLTLTGITPKQNALQRIATPRFPSHQVQDQNFLDNRIEVEPIPIWDKGTFIDTYA